jgi:hypothetical protein
MGCQALEKEADDVAENSPEDANVNDPELPEVVAAREFFEAEEYEQPRTIKQIVAACLKDVKKLRTVRSIKMVTQLTAVTEYVKLRERYREHGRCKRPHLAASLAVAKSMGKGSYFARQTRHNEIYLIRHKRLPPSKASGKDGQYTLLDNETILLGVRRYLAAQSLGSVTPHHFCKHVNEVILPAIALCDKRSTICERTAHTWLKKLGYTCTDVKNGLYHDGHEQPDVVEA